MSEPSIHESAIVSADTDIHPTVEIGPGAVIEGNVTIGAGTRIGPHVVIREFTRIGEHNEIDAHAVIGGKPQHLAWDGEETWVEIGDHNVMREYVTVNRGFEPQGVTRVGSNCFFMTCSHVGHDCKVGDNVTLTNNATLAGHVEVGRNAIFGGMAATLQFTRVGAFAMVAGFIPLRKDTIPFMMIGGSPVRHYRLNSIGLKRNGITGDRYRALETAYRSLRKGDRSLGDAPETEDVAYLRDWLSVKSKYGVYGFASSKRSERD